ncbi:52 kDa repressor of the inhibitor of the protein kinase-like [Mytilus edulis]|uniref:52 kDa repressor of the inhibitor of the protein kinase-like n=1 Tax=Mytilus edulis TaxID=6550 RepID=UPI0039EFCF70
MAESSGCQNTIGTSSMPPYPDIEDSKITDEIKYDILKRPWTSIHSYEFPVRVISNSTRRAKAKWFLKHTWMKYSKTTDSVYCAPCRFFGPKSGTSKEKTFGVNHVTDWSNITKLIQRHISMKSHETSLSAADDFLDVMEECKATTGESLTESFLENLRAKGVIVNKMRGQGYDGAANMAGKYRGVQARIKEVVPGAVYTHSHAALGELSLQHGDSKAGPYQAAIEKFDFIITLVASEHVLSALVALSCLLQKKGCDLFVAADESKVVVRQLNDERNDPEVWNSLYDSAVELAATVNTDPSMPRNRGAQRNRPNAPAQTPSEYWKLNMYLPFVDHLIAELNTRLLTAEPRYVAQKLIPKNIDQLTLAVGDIIFNEYADDAHVTKDEFRSEIRRWLAKWTGDFDNIPNNLQETLNVINKDLYPGIFQILNVFACMPVSTATAERSFSTIRRVKTYLRNTMKTNRLSGLGLLNIYREKQIKADTVLDIFSRKKERKWALIFQN